MPPPDELDYFRSITMELQALKNRVRHFIGNRHWLTDGEWKESVLRAVLRRHLPQSMGVGSGFVITPQGPSTQIDILIYDRTKPVLYQDGDLLIVTADLCLGIIEVKTHVEPAELRDALQKLADCRELVSRSAQCRPVTGLFAFDHDDDRHEILLGELKAAGVGRTRRVVNCVALGQNLFARYWECRPEGPQRQADIYRAYRLPEMAPAYFVHNIFEALCAESVLTNNHIWYPAQGKEMYQLGEIALKDQ